MKMGMLAAFAALALTTGCPKPALKEPLFIARAPGVWTSWPPPFAFTELGVVVAQGWTLQLAQEAAASRAREAGGVGIARATATVRLVTLPPAECDTTPGCRGGGVVIDEDFGETYRADGDAAIWTVTGVAVGLWQPPEAHEPAAVEASPASP